MRWSQTPTFYLMASVRPVDMVVPGEEVALAEVLLLPTLRPAWVIGDAPLDAVLPLMTMAPMGWPVTQPGMETGVVAGEEIAGAGVAEACRVEERRRKDMLLLHAEHLLAQALVNQAQRILR